jgi:hypothetical protein
MEWDKDASRGGTPVRAITPVPEPLNGWADEASPRDPPRWGASGINFSSLKTQRGGLDLLAHGTKNWGRARCEVQLQNGTNLL